MIASRGWRSLRCQLGRSVEVLGVFWASVSSQRSSTFRSRTRDGEVASQPQIPPARPRCRRPRCPRDPSSRGEEADQGRFLVGPRLPLGARPASSSKPRAWRSSRSRPAPERGEGRHVVGVDAGDGRRRDGPDRRAGVGPELVLDDVHPGDGVAVERGFDLGRDRPQVLADEPGLAAVRLDREDRVDLGARGRDERAVLRLGAVGDPEQPVEPHDVVDPEGVGVPEVVPERGDQVAVAATRAGGRGATGESPSSAPW